MKQTSLASVGLIALALAGCGAPPATAIAPPRVVSQPYFEPEIVERALAYRDALAEPLPFDIESRTRDQALEAAEAGEAALVVTSGAPPEGWFVTPVGRVGLAVIVHPDNPVRDLDLEEVQSLFAGRTASWAEVGGIDGPVQPVLPLPDEPAGEAFLQAVLGAGRPWPGTLLAPTPSAMIELVSQDVWAIGLVPMAALTEGVQPVRLDGVPLDEANLAAGRYPLTLELLATAPEEPGAPVRLFLVWLQERLNRPSD